MEKTDVRRRVKECEGERRCGAVTDRRARGGEQRMSGSIGPLLNRWRTSHIETEVLLPRHCAVTPPFSFFVRRLSHFFALHYHFLLLAFYILRLFSIIFGHTFDHLPPHVLPLPLMYFYRNNLSGFHYLWIFLNIFNNLLFQYLKGPLLSISPYILLERVNVTFYFTCH